MCAQKALRMEPQTHGLKAVTGEDFVATSASDLALVHGGLDFAGFIRRHTTHMRSRGHCALGLCRHSLPRPFCHFSAVSCCTPLARRRVIHDLERGRTVAVWQEWLYRSKLFSGKKQRNTRYVRTPPASDRKSV